MPKFQLVRTLFLILSLFGRSVFATDSTCPRDLAVVADQPAPSPTNLDRRASRRALNAIRREISALLRADPADAASLRTTLEEPFRSAAPHPAHFEDQYVVTKYSLDKAWGRVRSAADWITLAGLEVYGPFAEPMRAFTTNHLPDLVRVAGADLADLDLPWDPAPDYARDLRAANPRSVLGLLRDLRDSLRDPRGRDDRLYRTDRTLMNAAVDRLGDAARVADRLMALPDDGALLAALRTTRSWTRVQSEPYFRHADLRPAVILHVERAMLIYLAGRSAAGSHLHFGPREAHRLEVLRRAAARSGQEIETLHLDSNGGRQVRVRRASRT